SLLTLAADDFAMDPLHIMSAFCDGESSEPGRGAVRDARLRPSSTTSGAGAIPCGEDELNLDAVALLVPDSDDDAPRAGE
ncbi:MAG: hypothetical protein ACKPKO_12535, partial [Candidatus Fonsibacter sp.]